MIASSKLVPGDLIEITNDLRIPADIVLTYGKCVVRDNFEPEDNQTRTKLSIEDKNVSISDIKPIHMLYSGNRVLYTLNHINECCFGVVVNTGFNTRRGDSIRKTLITKKKDKILMNDFVRFYGLLFFFAVLASVYFIIENKLTLKKIFRHKHRIQQLGELYKIIQIFIVILKPALPIALMAAINCAVNKMKNKGIFSNNKNKISDLGKSNHFFIDQKILLKQKRSDSAFLVCK